MTDISELIVACRARLAAVAENPASDPLFDYAVWAVETMPRLLDALEAAQRPPLGYVVGFTLPDGGLTFARDYGGPARRAAAEEELAQWAEVNTGVEFKLLEVREAQS